MLTPSLPPAAPHAVSRLRSARLARSSKPFLARGGSKAERCAGCRLVVSHCLCALRPAVPVQAGVCLIMADIEALKPSNTGWLVADVVPDTFAFGWTRTEVDPVLLALLADEPLAAQTLAAYLDVFTSHYLLAKQQLPVDWGSAAHQRLSGLQANEYARNQLLNQE